jgi:hypothetical protein
MFGYIDESGTPGIANRPDDYLVVSLVLFADKETAEKCSASIDRLRKRLKVSDNYEFHFSRNNSRCRDGLVKLMANFDFKFITVAIRKNATHELASYNRVADLLIHELVRHAKTAHILMDINPMLHNKLKRLAKAEQSTGLRFKQVKSHPENLVQLADYVATLCARKVKAPKKSLAQFHRTIGKKQLAFLEITA